MGQTVTQHANKILPEWLKSGVQRIHVELKRDVSYLKREFTLTKDVAMINYRSLRETVANLNAILRKCCGSENEKVLFGVYGNTEEGSNILWKTVVKIICFKVNAVERKVTVTRYMNIHEFWRLRAELIREISYKNLLDEHMNDGFELVDRENPPTENDETVPEQELEVPQLSVSNVLERIDKVGHGYDDECLICMDNKIDVSLPCAHSYCAKCINHWSIENHTCPICREKIDNQDEFWEFADMPNVDQMNQHLLALATGT